MLLLLVQGNVEDFNFASHISTRTAAIGLDLNVTSASTEVTSPPVVT